jgi:para-aminobenzoate synthetase/4-amino-4-deoxychorismate lyase
VVRIPLVSELTPEQALLWLRGDDRPFALVGEWAGVRAVLGSEPVRSPDDPFALDVPEPAGDARVGGGWFGVWGYRLGSLIEQLPPPPPAPVETPACSLAFYDHVVVCDEEGWWFEALGSDHPQLDVWRERLGSPPPSQPFAVGPLSPAPTGAAGHLAAVEDCVRRIAEGELFQANLTLRLEGSFSGDALDLFAAALPVARPRFGACFPGIVSLSPERFLRRVGRHVETDPIKGTADAPEPLLASAKDAAEHVMIVDLMRNDLGRVCEYGSIRAHEPRVEAHANVFHLVSTVSGTLREDATDADLLRATFPPGSVTGAPKVQAMKVISELESTRREAYTGAIGYVSPHAGLELSVTIRTFELAGDRIWIGAGGGIVADSDPDAELAEALTKATGPARAAGSEVLGGPNPSVSRVLPPTGGVRRALEHGPRPDPSLGLLETIRVEDGEAPWLADHLNRLNQSAQELYGIEGPKTVDVPAGSGRLRLVLRPDGAIDSTLLPLADIQGLDGDLIPYVLPGGLGRHKWADRRLAEALGPNALIVDGDGAVLEATWSNIFIVEGDRTITPPADGRLLPGIHRSRVEADEEPLTLERLRAADSWFLTSALRRYSPSSSAYSRV